MKTRPQAEGRRQNSVPGSRFTFHVSPIAQLGSRSLRTQRAFTMIEIAISLAVIGFALVAIIGILPTALNVQKDNRQETIINQDASIFMNGIRNGERGLDDLTNYVVAITNYWRGYTPRGAPSGSAHVSAYTYTNSWLDSGLATPQFPITNGSRIIGLLSRPKIIPQPGGAYLSNHMVAVVRSISGAASEKSPQTNSTLQELGLSYKLISEVVPYNTNFFYPDWTDYGRFATNTPEYTNRYNYAVTVSNLQLNLHEVRLTFRWPVLPNGNSGPGRQVFRTSVSGFLQPNPEAGYNNLEDMLYFFQPGNFVQAP